MKTGNRKHIRNANRMMRKRVKRFEKAIRGDWLRIWTTANPLIVLLKERFNAQ